MSSRYRAHSDPSSPTTSPSSSRRRLIEGLSVNSQPFGADVELAQNSLARLQITSDVHDRPGPRWPGGAPHPHSYAGNRARPPSVTPSTTSVSDGEDDEDELDLEPLGQTKKEDWLRKGKGKAGSPEEQEDEASGIAGTLPPEILLHIFRMLDRQSDIKSCLQVNKTWCLYAFSLLWTRPSFLRISQLAAVARILESDNPLLPYANTVKRINLSAVCSDIDANLFAPLKRCTRTERMTLGGSDKLSSRALCDVFGHMTNLVAVDLNKIWSCDDKVISTIAKGCPDLQGLNINGCTRVGDESMLQIAQNCKLMRRLKVNHCIRLSDESLVAIARSCPLLLEVDFAELPLLTSESIYALLLNATDLREAKFAQNIMIKSEAFPNLPELFAMTDAESASAAALSPSYMTTAATDPLAPLRMLRPEISRLEALKMVDLTNCGEFGDQGLKNLIDSAPKLKVLTLAKCSNLTDEGIRHIARLGKYLHHLHIAHVNLVTDAAITQVARSCTRLRYVDFACCNQLTDLSVFEIASNLPKLRRIGLVKVNQITDEAIYALVERSSTLERVHLSYCEKVSVNAITYFLNKLPRLTHLSLTGVPAFKTREYQQFCRPAPEEFNDHQQRSFCVFSGDGIRALRLHLNSQIVALTSDDGSTRRDSSSSTSSITIDGPGSRRLSPPIPGGFPQIAAPANPDVSGSSHHFHNTPSTFSTLASRRSSAPSNRDRNRVPSGRRTVIPDAVALNSAFASPTPNFFAPSPSASAAGSTSTASPRRHTRDRERIRSIDRGMPGSVSSSAVSSMVDRDETYLVRIARPLPPLPDPHARDRAEMSSSAAELARSRASHQRQAPFVYPTPLEHSSRDNRPRHAPPSSSTSSSSRSNDTTRQRVPEPAPRPSETSSSGSPLRWMAGIVGWGSDRDRDRDRERSRDQDRDRR